MDKWKRERRRAEDRAAFVAVIAAHQRRTAAALGITVPELVRRQKEQRAVEEAERERAEQDRNRRLVEFCGSHAPAILGLPDALAVGMALSEKHVDGGSVRLAALIQEAHLSPTAEGAAVLCKSQVGKDLAATLRLLHWQRRRRGSGVVWVPPVTVASGDDVVNSEPAENAGILYTGEN